MRNLKSHYVKIVDESILFFSRVSLSKFSLENSLHFVGIRVFIVRCMRNVKSQLQPNKAFWRLELVTGTSSEFESRANCLTKLEVLSCNAIVGVTLQLPLHASNVCHSSNLPAARSSRETLLNCTLLRFLHTLSHTTLK